jgi:predicted ATP-grasp superfamily ATP-dependent carboligase
MNNSTKLSVLIPDGESPHAVSVLRCFAEINNLKAYVLSNDKYAPARFSRYPVKFISYSGLNDSDDLRLGAILHAVKSLKPDIILPLDIRTIRLLAANNNLFSELSSIALLPEIRSFDLANDKWLLAQWLKENRFPHPETNLYDDSNNFKREISSFQFPVLAKPRNGSGGKGIKYFDNLQDLKEFTSQINKDEYIIQSFIEGYDIDCSVLCEEGTILAYTIQKGYLFEAGRVSWPAGIEFLEHEETYNLVKETLAKLNWSGIIHIDLRYDSAENRVNLIEMNPRFWLSVMASLFAGVNFPYLACLAGLKMKLPIVTQKPARVVRTKTAMKLITKQLFHKRQGELQFTNSFIQLIIKDPVPNIFIKSRMISKKLRQKLS